MVKKYNPVVEKEYDNWDEVTYHYPNMEETANGQYVKLETYQNQLKEKQKLQKIIDRYKRRLEFLEGKK